METEKNLVNEIDIGLRHLVPANEAVDRLAASMKAIGLRTPITAGIFPSSLADEDGLFSDDSMGICQVRLELGSACKKFGRGSRDPNGRISE